MKTLRLVEMALFTIFMCVNFAACSNEENEVPQEGKEIMVSLGFGGDFEISESPLSRATSNDLYIIDARHLPSATNISVDEKYACGIFDDISNIKIKLVEGEAYCFFAYIIKDGKTKLKHDGNIYNNYPFINASLNNSFTYSETGYIDLDTDKWTLTDGNTYSIPNIVVYANNEKAIASYIATKDVAITLDMSRWVFGAKFEAVNLTEGTLNICIDDDSFGKSPTITLDTSTPIKEDIFYFPMQYSNTDFNFDVSVIWNKNGEEIELGKPTIIFKKDMMTTVKIIVEKTTENNINFNLDETPLEDNKTYIVDGNSVEEEN